MTSTITQNKRRLSIRQLVMEFILVSKAFKLMSNGEKRMVKQLLIVKGAFCFTICCHQFQRGRLMEISCWH
jgi:hypothetical protein